MRALASRWPKPCRCSVWAVSPGIALVGSHPRDLGEVNLSLSVHGNHRQHWLSRSEPERQLGLKPGSGESNHLRVQPQPLCPAEDQEPLPCPVPLHLELLAVPHFFLWQT